MAQLATRRSVLIAAGSVAASAALPCGFSTAAGTDSLRKRKNIDTLTSAELSAYEHAIGIVKARSNASADDPTGYLYWANLHNDFDTPHSGCSHYSEKFLPWHRRHLYDFENVLRQTDPSITSDLMIPYWDWTTTPKGGGHFPSAFLQPSSPLFDQRLTRTPPPWDESDIKNLVKDPDWSLFAGKPDAAEGFGQNPGSVESGPHNTLHGNISRHMANPESAALDAIFWSFHAFVDLVWTRWHRLHVADQNPQPFKDGAALLWYRDRSFSVASTAKTADFQYEYDYDYSIDGPLIAAPAIAVAAAGVSVVASTGQTSALVAAGETGRALSFRPQGRAAPSAVLRLGDVKVFHDKTYRLELYLHPPGVAVASMNVEARRAFLIRTVTLWKAHHDLTAEVFVRLSQAQVGHINEGWVVTVLSEAVIGDDEVRLLSSSTSPGFSLPPTSNLIHSLEIQER